MSPNTAYRRVGCRVGVAAVAIATARPSQLLQPAQRGGGADAATCRRPKLLASEADAEAP
eukprot:scaffold21878_cov27-Phaeocystis_antarctica.AAC.2